MTWDDLRALEHLHRLEVRVYSETATRFGEGHWEKASLVELELRTLRPGDTWDGVHIEGRPWSMWVGMGTDISRCDYYALKVILKRRKSNNHRITRSYPLFYSPEDESSSGTLTQFLEQHVRLGWSDTHGDLITEANVFADWLEDNEEPTAAEKLRKQFPVSDEQRWLGDRDLLSQIKLERRS